MAADPENEAFDETYDVVVIGGGLAGHCAAIEAAEAGAQTLLIEQQAKVGGSTVLSGGFFAFAGTPLQTQRGIADDGERLVQDLRTVGNFANDPALLAVYAAHQLDLYRWLTSQGVTFEAVELSAGQSVPRSHRTDAVVLIETLQERLSRLPDAACWTGVGAKRLIRESLDGRVAGVAVERDARSIRLAARRGVVLASGGFSRSEDLLQLFAPNQARALRIGGAGNLGDGLKMAWHLGAGFRDMGYIKGTFGTHPDTGPDKHEILLAFYLGAIIVNKQGARFVDESASYKTIGDACLAQDGQIGFQVFDQSVMDRSSPGVPLFDLAPQLEAGRLIRADSLTELAKALDMDPARLDETVATYNRAVDGEIADPFGRDGLCHHSGALIRLERPPFYAYPSVSVVLATYCGLTVAADAAVQDVFGAPIAGLYAAGEITGGFHGAAYMTGSSLGKAALFGRLAGRNAASRMPS